MAHYDWLFESVTEEEALERSKEARSEMETLAWDMVSSRIQNGFSFDYRGAKKFVNDYVRLRGGIKR